MTPEVRLSPDGDAVALRFPLDRHWTINRYRDVQRFGSEELVSDWTPLRPASSEDDPK